MRAKGAVTRAGSKAERNQCALVSVRARCIYADMAGGIEAAGLLH